MNPTFKLKKSGLQTFRNILRDIYIYYELGISLQHIYNYIYIDSFGFIGTSYNGNLHAKQLQPWNTVGVIPGKVKTHRVLSYKFSSHGVVGCRHNLTPSSSYLAQHSWRVVFPADSWSHVSLFKLVTVSQTRQTNCKANSPRLHLLLGLRQLRLAKERHLPCGIPPLYFMNSSGSGRQYLHHANHPLHIDGGNENSQTLWSCTRNRGSRVTLFHVEFILKVAVQMSTVGLGKKCHHCRTGSRGGYRLRSDAGVPPEKARVDQIVFSSLRADITSNVPLSPFMADRAA